MSAEAKLGDTVQVYYLAKTQDQLIYDSFRQQEPLQFTIGQETLIPAFEEAVIGMREGEKKSIAISAEKAFGPYLNELISTVQKNLLPKDVSFEKGQQFQLKQPDGQILLVKVIDVSDATVTFDANHPLAGKDITFEIELIKII